MRSGVGVEAVEVGVAAVVDPDAVGLERRRLGAGLLERVDGVGDLADVRIAATRSGRIRSRRRPGGACAIATQWPSSSSVA